MLISRKHIALHGRRAIVPTVQCLAGTCNDPFCLGTPRFDAMSGLMIPCLMVSGFLAFCRQPRVFSWTSRTNVQDCLSFHGWRSGVLPAFRSGRALLPCAAALPPPGDRVPWRQVGRGVGWKVWSKGGVKPWALGLVGGHGSRT